LRWLKESEILTIALAKINKNIEQQSNYIYVKNLKKVKKITDN